MDAQKLFRNAQQLFVEGKHKESIMAFSDSINAGFKSEIVYLSRGVAFLKSHQIDKAIDDFSTVIKMNGSNVRAYFYRGIAYMNNKEFTDAIRDFDKTIELKPDYGIAFFARGSAYAQIGNEFEAARNIKTAITYSESNIQGFADTFGLFRTQFDKAMAIMADKDRAPSMYLTEDELKKVKKWLDVRDH